MAEIDARFDGITLRKPTVEDGAEFHALVRECKPLDENSVYCNLLQCTDFADTCMVAEKDGRLVGLLSGYLKPAEPQVYFLWQVGVSEAARGHGLALKMVQAVLARDFCRNVRELQCTITRSNEPSRALFRAVAEAEGASVTEEDYFLERHFGDGGHEAEYLFHIHPLKTPKATG